jgi:hypothetical protein
MVSYQNLARQTPGVFAIGYNALTVDQHMMDSCGILVGIFESSGVGDLGFIKHDNIGPTVFLQQPPVF